MRECGLVLSKHDHGPKFVYGHKFGFGKGWLPYRIQRLIVHNWNWLACQIWDHDWLPDFDEVDIRFKEKEDGTRYIDNIDWNTCKHRQCHSCCKKEEAFRGGVPIESQET
jgi:hypothetical protein